jgi:hypothetical protein
MRSSLQLRQEGLESYAAERLNVIKDRKDTRYLIRMSLMLILVGAEGFEPPTPSV